MVSAIETLEAIVRALPPSAFRDDLQRCRDDIFVEAPEMTPFRFQLAAEVFEDHFPTDESQWETWQRQARDMFVDAQRRWMAENGIKSQ